MKWNNIHYIQKRFQNILQLMIKWIRVRVVMVSNKKIRKYETKIQYKIMFGFIKKCLLDYYLA